MDDDDVLAERELPQEVQPEDALELLRQIRADQPLPDIEYDTSITDDDFYNDDYDADEWFDRAENEDLYAQWE